MVDSCLLNPLECLNNGKCTVNISSNTTYCQCDPCHQGILCESIVWSQTQFDTTYVYFIISIIGLCFSLLNNGLIFELFIRCKRIRRSNCGTYLMVYSILSLVGSILLVTDQAVQYYPNRLTNNRNQREVFHCYVNRIGYNTFVYLCIVFSSCIAFQRGLNIRFGSKMDANRWLSFITIIVIFAIAGGSDTPFLVYKCDWTNIPNLQIARVFFNWFYVVGGIAIYVVATVLILISFVRRIHRYGTENDSRRKTFFKLLYTHLFIFVPPVAYGISQIPYTIVYSKNSEGSYFQCGISTAEFIIRVLAETLTGLPYVITWLLFVYPSRVYMNHFYLDTWSGQRLANIIIFLKSYNSRVNNVHLSTMNLIDNAQNIRELTV